MSDNARNVILKQAHDIDADAMAVDVSGPGKYEGIPADDRQLALALHVIAQHGFYDDELQGGAYRIDGYVIGEDSQGFVYMREATPDDDDDDDAPPSLADLWCDWKREGASDLVVFVIEDDGSDSVRIEYTEGGAGMGVQYADVARSTLSVRDGQILPAQ